jgi:hypothetical protein
MHPCHVGGLGQPGLKVYAIAHPIPITVGVEPRVVWPAGRAPKVARRADDLPRLTAIRLLLLYVE